VGAPEQAAWRIASEAPAAPQPLAAGPRPLAAAPAIQGRSGNGRSIFGGAACRRAPSQNNPGRGARARGGGARTWRRRANVAAWPANFRRASVLDVQRSVPW